MLRKNIRLRREYLFNRENEKNIKEKYEKKREIKSAILRKCTHFFKHLIYNSLYRICNIF